VIFLLHFRLTLFVFLLLHFSHAERAPTSTCSY
jgi:hypothetical protein